MCFLLASRINPEITPDPRSEDTSVILLSVMDHADLPNAEEAKRVRIENAQRVSGESAGGHGACGPVQSTSDRALAECAHVRAPGVGLLLAEVLLRVWSGRSRPGSLGAPAL